ncbi:hypothetical protein [Actinomyces ruminis]|uniref:Uncharacterized protein n=1 Tax=Actinomyces ruminis TaxID=1937003 RepID=A0ABX4MCQ4_9ACTO|nr:hypothetical protein [Actinomyces ruminis]PHP53262.1 hypothetical protein BW737_004030 [Actinomyces ruminis]
MNVREHEELRSFTVDVMYNVLVSDLPTATTNDRGESPVVACLDSELLSDVMARVAAVGGYATVFSRGSLSDDGTYAVRFVDFVDEACAIDLGATDMTEEAPAESASMGMFLDYLETQEHGVVLPKQLGSSAAPEAVTSAKAVEFQAA